MLIKILDEEKDRPIVISWSGERISLPRLTDGEEDAEIFINNDWNVVYGFDGCCEENVQCNLPLAPGTYGKDEIRAACVMFLRFILSGPKEDLSEGDDDDKYIIYEIVADTVKKVIQFDVEVLDEDSEVEFNLDTKNNNITDLFNYEQQRIIKVKG